MNLGCITMIQRQSNRVLNGKVANPPPVKAKAARSAEKVMMVIFFDHTGFIYQYVLLEKTTVTKDVYLQILKQFLHTFAKKPLRMRIFNMLLHQDNARPHVAHTVLDFLTSKGIQLGPQRPYPVFA